MSSTGARRQAPFFGLGLALALALPWLPGEAGAGDAYAALGLSGVVLPGLACLAALGGAPWWRVGLAVGGAWSLAFGAAAVLGPRPLEPGGSWLGLAALWCGWALAGAGSGARAVWSDRADPGGGAPRGLGLALAWVALGALLSGLPGRFERAPEGPDRPASWAQGAPERAALLLDLSPATLAFEVAGVDWMRHPAVYEPAGTDWFSGSRAPWSAGLAGPLALVLGCVFGGCCAGFRGGRETRAHTSG